MVPQQRRSWIKPYCLGILIPALLASQQFEEASVKHADECMPRNTIDPGMAALHGDSLKAVLMTAFSVKMDEIVGPSWLDSDCVSIDAKIPEGATKDQLPQMLQVLLTERFRLAAHKESKSKTGYALVVDKNGPKFKESDPATPGTRAPAGATMFGTGQLAGSMTMASLARFISTNLGTPVEDLTGLKGSYDVDLSWSPDWSVEKKQPGDQAYEAHPDSADAPAGPDIFAAFRDTLGLRLERRKVPVDVLVIDHIERLPTPN